ncbi:YlxM family DNA-binding protein [Parasporobacterium paucivorans]|uniref:UPF0122 protein SAMN02745691_00002 n=1 Tax=Parasporobacterium paucivorans DSM 15970 TaxID=1122934 RepID=A0A1M5ZZW7_9FIRM|nr:DNA-binding protein [Parasporobacterium paucivorans]SHI29629.1 hypothetical protein SAMN02745691_00002 [Parasporobacterium paucivorans DSM 15970]
MEKILEQSLLYDFYGELLNPHQKNIYEDFALNNLTLSEIAEEKGISRQAVHDSVKRSEAALSGYEEKLHLIEKFLKIKELTSEIKSMSASFEATKDFQLIKKISSMADKILEEL